MTIFIIIFRFV